MPNGHRTSIQRWIYVGLTSPTSIDVNRRRNNVGFLMVEILRRFINVGEITSNVLTNSYSYAMLDLCSINITDVDQSQLTSKQRWIS